MNLNHQCSRSQKILKRHVNEIPASLLKQARGIMFMTQAKAGFFVGGTVSSGIIISRKVNGEWGNPCSVGLGGVSIGLQWGGQIVDLIVVFMTDHDMDALFRRGQFKVGTDYAIAVGPMGADLDMSAYMSRGGAAGAFSYSFSKGLFLGVSIDGAVIVARSRDNKGFYGEKCTLAQIRAGEVFPKDSKKAANLDDLHACLKSFENGTLNRVVEPSPSLDLDDEEVLKASKDAEKNPDLQTDDILANTGKALLVKALDTPSATAGDAPSKPVVVFLKDHLVDESNPAISKHGIISVRKDEIATLVSGTLEGGMGGAYHEYVEVNYGGKIGKVSRYVVALVDDSIMKKNSSSSSTTSIAAPIKPASSNSDPFDFLTGYDNDSSTNAARTNNNSFPVQTQPLQPTILSYGYPPQQVPPPPPPPSQQPNYNYGGYQQPNYNYGGYQQQQQNQSLSSTSYDIPSGPYKFPQ